jgi:hypothetical protein
MNEKSISTEPSFSLSSCCLLATEVWRLRRYVESLGEATEAVSLRYSMRQLSKMLEALKITVIDLAGRPYDSGMIQEVLEVLDDPELLGGQQIIAETISPTVTWNGAIVQPGQITLRRSPLLDPATTEVSA